MDQYQKPTKMASKIRSTMGVTTCDTPQDRLNYLHDTLGLSWREIANLDDYSGIPAGTLSSIASGKKPVPKKYCQRLGIPIPGQVMVLIGEIPEGCLVLAGQVCECGQAFVSNHPARAKCFICRPYKGKRRG